MQALQLIRRQMWGLLFAGVGHMVQYDALKAANFSSWTWVLRARWPASQVLAGAEALGTRVWRACFAVVKMGHPWSAVVGMGRMPAGISRTGQGPVAELKPGAGACCFAVAHASRPVAQAADPLHLGDGCAEGSNSQQAFPCWRLPCSSGHTPRMPVCSAAGQLAGRSSICTRAECESSGRVQAATCTCAAVALFTFSPA